MSSHYRAATQPADGSDPISVLPGAACRQCRRTPGNLTFHTRAVTFGRAAEASRPERSEERAWERADFCSKKSVYRLYFRNSGRFSTKVLDVFRLRRPVNCPRLQGPSQWVLLFVANSTSAAPLPPIERTSPLPQPSPVNTTSPLGLPHGSARPPPVAHPYSHS